MKWAFILLLFTVFSSCVQSVGVPRQPMIPIATIMDTVPIITTPEKVLGPEYDAFDGDFIYADGRGFTVLVSFLGEDKAMAVCITANAKPYFNYVFTLDNGTITTYNGTYPIIWWFQCVSFPYRWDNADTLVVTDPVDNRVLTLRRR